MVASSLGRLPSGQLARDSHQASHQQTGVDAKWISWLAIFVVLAAILSVIAFVFLIHQPQRPQYRIMLVFLFFAIATVSSLLFATKVNVHGVVGGFTFTIVGPAALWIVALLLFNKFFPEDEAFRVPEYPIQIDKLAQLADNVQEQLGWKNYFKWKMDLNDFVTLLSKEERNTMKDFLSYTYLKTDGNKLKQPEITTVLYYFKDRSSIKLQRIRGYKEGDTFALRFKSGTTLPSPPAEAHSVLLVGDEEQNPLAIVEGYADSKQDTADVSSGIIDCLIVSQYLNDIPDDGDLLATDLKRYSSDSMGTVRVGFVTFDKPLWKFHLSMMQPRWIARGGEMPLLFKRDSQEPKSLEPVRAQLRQWVTALDASLTNQPPKKLGDEPKIVLRSIRDRIAKNLGVAQDQAFSKLLASKGMQGEYAFYFPDAHDVILAMYLWR